MFSIFSGRPQRNSRPALTPGRLKGWALSARWGAGPSPNIASRLAIAIAIGFGVAFVSCRLCHWNRLPKASRPIPKSHSDGDLTSTVPSATRTHLRGLSTLSSNFPPVCRVKRLRGMILQTESRIDLPPRRRDAEIFFWLTGPPRLCASAGEYPNPGYRRDAWPPRAAWRTEPYPAFGLIAAFGGVRAPLRSGLL